MDTLTQILANIASYVWGTPLIVLIIVTGIMLTVRLGLIQFRGFFAALRMLVTDAKAPGQISHFQALSTALSATVGLGNIAGVAIAISLGGPGAVFWMWMIGFIGMATKSASCTLAVKYRIVDDNGAVHGGPMYYIDRGLGWKPLAVIFAALVTLASFGGGNMFQSNQVAAAMSGNFGIPEYITGLVLSGGVALVILGGITRIGQVAAAIVPLMCVLYLIGAIGVVVTNIEQLPWAIALIFTDAFSGNSVAGGVLGTVIQQGVRRGTFSNESGLGSAPIAHAAARTDQPASEGMVGLLEPFIDTIVVCTMTAMVIIITGIYQPSGTFQQSDSNNASYVLDHSYQFSAGEEFELWREGEQVGTFVADHDRSDESNRVHGEAHLFENAGASLEGTQLRIVGGVALTIAGFDSFFHGFGSLFVSLAVLLFAFSTMISWSYYGEQGARYLWGERAVTPFKMVFVIMVFAGAIWGLDAVVNFSDIAYGLMAVPNLIALWMLSPVVKDEQQRFLRSMHQKG